MTSSYLMFYYIVTWKASGKPSKLPPMATGASAVDIVLRLKPDALSAIKVPLGPALTSRQFRKIYALITSPIPATTFSKLTLKALTVGP